MAKSRHISNINFYRRLLWPSPHTEFRLPEGYQYSIHRLRPWQLASLGSKYSLQYLLYCLIYTLVGGTRHYRGLAIADPSGIVKHTAMVFPRYFRFPFMGRDDLQIGLLKTDPSAEGLGLASYAVQELLRTMEPKNAFCWYLADQQNLPSLRVAEKNGFELVARGCRTSRLGLRLFGSFVIQESVIQSISQGQ